MKLLIICALLTILTITTGQISNPPEFKTVFDYGIFDILKTNVVEPLMKDKIHDIHLNKTFTLQKGPLVTEISNIFITGLTIDWTNTHILALNAKNQPSIMIKRLSADISFDANISFFNHQYLGGANSIQAQDVDIEVGLGFANYSNGTSYAFIATDTVGIQNLDINLSSKIADGLLAIAKLFGFNIEKIGGVLMETVIVALNNTIIEKSTQGLQVTLLDIIGLNLGLADLPYSFVENDKIYQVLSFNIALENILTNQTAPVAAADVMPDYIDDGLQAKLFISDTLINQVIWAAFESGKVNVELSSATLPASFPISMNTTNLPILFPNIAKDFGYDKGVYLKITKGGDNPFVAVNDGRIVILLALQIDFWVDVDSSLYPNQTIENCTTCQLAVSLNATAFVSVVLYEETVSSIGLKLISLELEEVDVLAGDVDGSKIADTLNNIITALIVQINIQLQNGFQNPLMGLLGMNETSVAVGTDYVLFGISLKE